MKRCDSVRRATTLIEMVLGALILGVSATLVVELMRSSTVSLQVTEAEAVSRSLAADVLERFASPPSSVGKPIDDTTRTLLSAYARWDLVLNSDPSLRAGFPQDKLGPILNQADVHLMLKVDGPSPNNTLGLLPGMECVTVTVHWMDHHDMPREASFARLVEQ